MTKYFGVIVDLISRTTESIEGEYPHKPSIEEGGLLIEQNMSKLNPGGRLVTKQGKHPKWVDGKVNDIDRYIGM